MRARDVGHCVRSTSSANVDEGGKELDDFGSVDRQATVRQYGGVPQVRCHSFEAVERYLDELERLHGVYSKGRLYPLLSRYLGYFRSANESIDQMASNLQHLRAEIYDVSPKAVPSLEVQAIIIMNACKGDEYQKAKEFLLQADNLKPALAVDILRNVDMRKKHEKGVRAAKRSHGKSDRQRKT